MNISTLLAIVAVALLLTAAIRIIYKNRKQGKGCAGCPYAGNCGGHCASNGNCRQHNTTEKK